MAHCAIYMFTNTTNLVNYCTTLKAHYLVVELRSNPHVQVHIQLIVVSNKWTGHCSTRDNVHHWRLNLKDSTKHAYTHFYKCHVVFPLMQRT